MSTTHLNHFQEWVLTVRPESGETWPRCETRDGEMQPLTLTFSARPGTYARSGLAGQNIRRDGSVGLRHATTSRLPEWAAALLASARAEYGLTEEFLRNQGVKIPGRDEL